MKIELYPKQRWAFYSPATEVLFGGAAGPGKSFLLRVSAIRWCEQVPGIQVYLFRRTFPDLRDNHLRGPTSFFALLGPLIDSGLVKYNKQDNEFVWVKTSSRIKLCHCQHEDDVQNYQGAEIHVLMPDELTHFTEYQYRFLRGRVRCVGLQIPEQFKSFLPRIEAASNPGSIGHAWVKRMFIQSPMEIYRVPANDGGMLRQYIPAKSTDNPRLLEEDPGYNQRLEGLGSEMLVRAMKDGDWDITAGQFFDLWRRDIHVLPRDFKIEPWWNKFGGYDHGYDHPFAWGAYATDGDGNTYKYCEVGARRKHPPEIEDMILEACPEAKGFTHWAGHDIWSRQRDGGPEIVEQFKKLRMVKANIDRKQGAAHLRQHIYYKIDNNVMVTRPKFFVLENCWRTISQISEMVYNEHDVNDVLKINATDQDPWAGDDFYDETRYAMMSRPPISRQAEAPMQKYSLEWFRMRTGHNKKRMDKQLYRLNRYGA